MAVLLSACTSWLGGDDEEVLPGERISILAFEDQLAPTDASEAPITLNQPVPIASWSQGDSNADNRPLHAAYSGSLSSIWNVKVGRGEGRASRILNQPIVDGSHLYVLDGDGHVVALSLETQRVTWEQSVRPEGKDGGRSVGGGVALDADRLFVTTGYGDVLALDRASGNVEWQRSYGIPFRGAPTIQGPRVYASLVTDQTVALLRNDGSEIWQHEGAYKEGPSILNAPTSAANDDVVVVPYSTGELVALRADNGREAWRVALVDTLQGATRIEVEDVAGSPVIDRNAVIAGSTTGVFGRFGIQTGTPLWQIPLSITQTPRIAGNWMYALAEQDDLVCLRLDNGSIRWRVNLAEVLGLEEDEETAWSGLVVAGESVIVAGRRHVAKLSPVDGSLVQATSIPADAASSPIVADGTLYVLTREGTIAAFR